MDEATFIYLCLTAGGLFVVMALASTTLARLPLTASMFYLIVGVLIGPHVAGWLRADPVRDAAVLERLTEAAVVISLFTAGLKLRVPLRDPRWWLTVRLAGPTMLVTVGLITLAGTQLLGLPLGAAVLLGAVLAPTDPVLASDVQVTDPDDRDRLRFALTGEAGLNDGTAFPFVMLGLGLLGVHELGGGGWRWWAIDLVWAVAAGLGFGALCGTLVGRLVVFLRKRHQEAVGLDDFLALGLIALSYGLALYAHAYGFLAVFAAGLAVRRVEMQATGHKPAADVVAGAEAGAKEEIATHPETAPAYMANAVLAFNEQLERIGEVALVVLLGAMLSLSLVTWEAVGFAALLFLILRPVAVLVGLAGSGTPALERGLIAWFGVRGIGSLYYLSYAMTHGLDESVSGRLVGLTLFTVAVSVVVHGVSVTPLMGYYERDG